MFKVKPGLQVAIEEQIDLLRASRIGLVTNQSAVMPDLTHITDALRFAGVTITALFAPEHGIMGAQPDGIDVQSSTDPRTGIPVHSLYSSPCKKPSPEMLFDVDLVVFDIQDVGCRYYTYLSTMAHVIQACAENGKKLIVLDRPNPINGMSVGGNILDPGFSSFIGVYPIPTRHGMTIGELALLFNEEFDIRADIEVIPCYGWNRSMWFDATGLPWVMPSPNMPTIETALLYPGLCLLEGTNLSEGRGTTRPFEIIGAPWIDGYELSDRLNAVGLPGVRFRPTWFAPNTSKFAGVTCGGVQVHVFDRNVLEPVSVGLSVLSIIHELHADEFRFLQPESSGHCHFDLLAGTDTTRLGILANKPVDELINSCYNQLQEFKQKMQKYLLYSC